MLIQVEVLKIENVVVYFWNGRYILYIGFLFGQLLCIFVWIVWVDFEIEECFFEIKICLSIGVGIDVGQGNGLDVYEFEIEVDWN